MSAGIAAVIGAGSSPTVGALRVGVLIGTALPLIGGLIAAFGPRSEDAERPARDGEP